jgi:DNA-binding transcriptional MerR regulator
MSNFEGPAAPKSGDAVPFNKNVESSEDTPLSISNVSKMFKVSRLTLWTYERLGLIKRRHRIEQSLVYDWTDCGRLAFIIKARRAGLSVCQVAPIIKATEAAAPIESVKAARASCVELIDQLDRRRQFLRETTAELLHFDKLLSSKLDGSVLDGEETSDSV